jgi:hypothetical protein
MATRPQGTKYKKLTASALVHTGIGNLYSFSASWRGVTAGNRIVIHDGVDATGPAIEEIILNDANSVNPLILPLPAVGKEFGTGLYINLGGITGGEVNVSVGYDGNG